MIDLENAILREAEQAAYAAGDTLKAKLLARIMDLEEELERVKDDARSDSLTAWESDHGPASAYVEFFFECFRLLANGKCLVPSVTSDADKQVIFDAIVRGEGS
jgi:hypothetical protein